MERVVGVAMGVAGVEAGQRRVTTRWPSDSAPALTDENSLDMMIS
jgi:hypothetical protein